MPEIEKNEKEIIPISSIFNNYYYKNILPREAPVLKMKVYTKFPSSSYNNAILDLYYEVIEKETFISFCLDLRTKYICSLKIMMKEIQNTALMDFIYKILYDNLNFNQLLKSILSALIYGYSVQEKKFEYKNGKWELIGYNPLPPHSICFVLDEQTNQVQMSYNKEGIDGGSGSINLSEYRDRFILYSYNPRFGNPYGQSTIDVGLYQYYLYKQQIKKEWYVAVRRYGKNIPYGIWQGDQTKEARETFTNEVAKLGSGYATAFRGDVFEIKELALNRAGSSELFKEYMKRIDNEISNKLLFTTMSSESDDVGSLARNEIYENVQQMAFYSDGRNLIDTLNNEIIKPEIIRNFGEQEEYPLLYIPDYEKDVNTAEAREEGEPVEEEGNVSVNQIFQDIKKMKKVLNEVSDKFINDYDKWLHKIIKNEREMKKNQSDLFNYLKEN